MQIEFIRMWNARALADREGGIVRFAEKVERSQSQISQIIGRSPVKTIEKRMARHIESVCGVSEGWLDQAHVSAWLSITRSDWRDMLRRDLLVQGISIDMADASATESSDESVLLTCYRMLKPEDKARLVEIAKVLAKFPINSPSSSPS